MRTAPVATEEKSSWFGHPPQLARLFTTEMWERFGFYGMRAILVLYLTKHFVFSDTQAGGLYGAFTSMCYLTPLFGGLLADRYLGYKRAVKLGALLMSIGYLVLCFGGSPGTTMLRVNQSEYPIATKAVDDKVEQWVTIDGVGHRLEASQTGGLSLHPQEILKQGPKEYPKGSFSFRGVRDPWMVALMFTALSCVIVGNGFFKPNISTMVGSLYGPADTRRDAGFTIFYMGINIGAMLSQLLCPVLFDSVGAWAGFGLAASGMLLAFMLIQFDGGRLNGYGEAPSTGQNWIGMIYVGAIVAVPAAWYLLNNTLTSTQDGEGASQGLLEYVMELPLLGKVLSAIFLTAIVGIPIWAVFSGTAEEAQKMIVAIVLVVFSVVFWTLFEQAGSSMTLFADRNTDRTTLFGYVMPAGQVQVFNAIFIVALAPVFSILWMTLAKSGLDPSIPVKFALALALVGLGFLVLVYGGRFASPTFQVGLSWLVLAYLIHSIGELCLSPVGLSMITKLSMPRVVGLMMGVWMLSSAMAQYVAGLIAQSAAVETVGGQVTDLSQSLQTYLGVFAQIGWWSIGFGVALLVLSPFLRRMMHGVT